MNTKATPCQKKAPSIPAHSVEIWNLVLSLFLSHTICLNSRMIRELDPGNQLEIHESVNPSVGMRFKAFSALVCEAG